MSSMKCPADEMGSPMQSPSLQKEPLQLPTHSIPLPHSLGWEQVVAAPCFALQRREGENIVSKLNTSLAVKMAARGATLREGNPLCPFF